MATFEEAKQVAKNLAGKLFREFNTASQGLVHMVGVGVDRDKNELFIVVGVSRELTKEEREKIPREVEGIRVECRVEPPAVLH